ncbi:MAG: ABC transporter permease, partial [Candidatus Doudnabacteria bacterium]|nr:ABC transporter permease [Candidatus Doudnabacteria bacterium]
MSFLLINLRAVLRTMKARKARTLLTILGIVIGVAGVILIVAMGAGAQHLVLSQITKLGTNLIGVLPGKSDESGPPAAVFGVQVTTLTNQDAEALANRTRFPDIQAVAGFVRGSATLVWKNENVDTFFTATQASYPVLHDLEMESGRFFEEQEETSAANVMVLGYDIKDLLFGNTDPLGQVVKIKSVPFVVVGVASKQGTVAFQNQDDQVFVPLLVGQRQLLGIKYLQFIRAKVEPDSDVKQIIAEIRLLLRERHKIAKEEDADFSVMALAEAIKVLTNITDSLRLFLTVMAGVALLVGGIGIMNIML